MEMIDIIEKDLIEKRMGALKATPADIYEQVDRIEKKAFEVWHLDSVFTGSVMLDSLKACSESRLTLDQLERLISLHGKEYESFDKFLKKATKIANKAGKKSISETIKGYLGRTTRNTEEIRHIFS